MKKTIVFTLAMTAGMIALAQPGKTPVKPAAPVLKNLNDSASYAIGLSVANFYKQQGIKNINSNLVAKACADVEKGKPLFDETVANNVMNAYMSKVQEEKSKPRIDSANNFLAQNKKRPGVKTTASGLQYEILTEGTGIKPTLADTFVVHYRGTLLNGTKFDASYDRNAPLVMALSDVVQGWKEGLQLMPVGSKFKLWIPSTLGYGAFDYGPIPGGSLLVFEMELLDVKKKAQ
jgi:FKBP-type peptidyl-prolyl cis-trans isomerase